MDFSLPHNTVSKKKKQPIHKESVEYAKNKAMEPLSNKRADK